MFPNFTKLGIEAGNGSRNLNLCFVSLFEKGRSRPHPFHVLRKLMYEFLFWMAQTDPLLYYSNDIERFSHKNCEGADQLSINQHLPLKPALFFNSKTQFFACRQRLCSDTDPK